MNKNGRIHFRMSVIYLPISYILAIILLVVTLPNIIIAYCQQKNNEYGDELYGDELND